MLFSDKKMKSSLWVDDNGEAHTNQNNLEGKDTN